MSNTLDVSLPGLDCGLCGYRTCEQLAAQLATRPELIKRCIHLANHQNTTSTVAESAARQAE